ncbi:MAG: flagellar hook protein, partial [Schwartzia sp.]|nr:flagellar hook protein [Schwartzia sp. (in: firmicutes)]
MRIGSYNTTVRYRNSINRTYEDQTKLIELSDGSKLHRPSDDCVNYSKYLRHSVTYSENNQYQTNVQTAISWMKNTDAALVDMTSAFSKIVVKSNQADGSNSDADMRAIAGEMLVQAQQAVADANTNVNGRYLFSGQADLVQPYEISKEMQQRGLAKTLDDKQMEFFDDTTKSGGVAQMLTMYGDDGNTYFLNTTNGNVYAEDFVEEGYKEKIASGQKYVAAGDDEAANIAGWGTSIHVSDHFNEYGVIDPDTSGEGKGINYSAKIKVGDKEVELKFTTVEQYIVTYKGDRKQFSMVKENGATQPSSDTVNASGVEIAGRGIFDNEDSGNGRLPLGSGNYFGPSGANAFNDMFTVHAMCDHGANDENGKRMGPDSNWMNSDGKTLANAAYHTVNSAQTKIASRQSVYRDCQAMLTTQNQQILGDITDVHSTDLAKLAVDMMKSQTVYNLS